MIIYTPSSIAGDYKFTFNPNKDYCGPEGNKLLSDVVPDGKFKAKCYNHDKCYEKGMNDIIAALLRVYNKPNNMDSLEEIRKSSKYSIDYVQSKCDDRFYDDLIDACNDIDPRAQRKGVNLKKACNADAKIYYKFVVKLSPFSANANKALRELESEHPSKRTQRTRHRN